MSYTYAIEKAAAESAFRFAPRERRFLQSAFEQIANAPFHPAEIEEIGEGGRILLTRFFGPFAVTYWPDHAIKEVRIAAVYRD